MTNKSWIEETNERLSALEKAVFQKEEKKAELIKSPPTPTKKVK